MSRQHHTGPKRPYQQKPRPTLFLAVRVDDEGIVERVKGWQTRMKALLPPNLVNCLIEPTKLHITLFVVYLFNQKALEEFQGFLSSAQCAALVEDFLASLKALDAASTANQLVQISFRGSGSFRDNIFWTAPVEDVYLALFKAFVGKLHSEIWKLNSAYLEWDAARRAAEPNYAASFTPHLTVFKTRHPDQLATLQKRANVPQLLSEGKDVEFGTQRFGRIEVLTFTGTPDGWYESIATIDLTNPTTTDGSRYKALKEYKIAAQR